MDRFLSCWLAEAPGVLEEGLAAPVKISPGATKDPGNEGKASLTLVATIAGGWCGEFSLTIGKDALQQLLPVADDAFERWQTWFTRISVAAAAALHSKTGKPCEIATLSPRDRERPPATDAYQLHAGGQTALLEITSAVQPAPEVTQQPPAEGQQARPRGMDLLLDVELEASLRFGAREMVLTEILELGAGDVVQLDRHVSDPVDLIVGDRIVARGEVVLVNGNFGLRISEIAEPKKCLESIRCLF